MKQLIEYIGEFLACAGIFALLYLVMILGHLSGY